MILHAEALKFPPTQCCLCLTYPEPPPPPTSWALHAITQVLARAVPQREEPVPSPPQCHSPAPRAAHGPRAVLQHSLEVGAILHMARDSAGHHVGAPVPKTDPQKGSSSGRPRTPSRWVKGTSCSPEPCLKAGRPLGSVSFKCGSYRATSS